MLVTSHRAPKPTGSFGSGECPVSSDEFLAVDIRAANTDPEAVGECPLALDPKRKEKMGDQGGFLSFGNGMHRCPGSPLALNETLHLMDRLLSVPGVRLASQPKIEWIEHLSSFQITDVLVTCD